ncbi:hypothetical protein E4K67_16155 [Desulfosporosinus fructosivorans]|uniref:Ornithine cyclodeaminase family protein n=1 Tax=Desulfosporosinus fructosivorans TaxID=2018669 RepID=A0A4Z0R4I1_9FIRM|nr:hypothetical protein [Desulfosporosinus fructosivorans]TGE37454.1 hypothetical protein E4K67_16155 [Desulfosporosinus fructosivorans]
MREIGQLIAGNVKGRISEQDTTIFDSTGIALQDITVSKYLVEKAEELKLFSQHIFKLIWRNSYESKGLYNKCIC